ncbi:MAG TPA: hypothetical protein PKE03_04455 [Bacteroidales bacterium]|nr:hypothetical protein [Bacteroidales bacterium]
MKSIKMLFTCKRLQFLENSAIAGYKSLTKDLGYLLAIHFRLLKLWDAEELSALKLDAEASLHLQAYESLIPLDDHPTAGLQSYRFCFSIANRTRSLRIGLQQITFVSANLGRPLMWYRGEGTIFKIKEINLDQQIPESIFSKASLK